MRLFRPLTFIVVAVRLDCPALMAFVCPANLKGDTPLALEDTPLALGDTPLALGDLASGDLASWEGEPLALGERLEGGQWC